MVGPASGGQTRRRGSGFRNACTHTAENMQDGDHATRRARPQRHLVAGGMLFSISRMYCAVLGSFIICGPPRASTAVSSCAARARPNSQVGTRGAGSTSRIQGGRSLRATARSAYLVHVQAHSTGLSLHLLARRPLRRRVLRGGRDSAGQREWRVSSGRARAPAAQCTTSALQRPRRAEAGSTHGGGVAAPDALTHLMVSFSGAMLCIMCSSSCSLNGFSSARSVSSSRTESAQSPPAISSSDSPASPSAAPLASLPKSPSSAQLLPGPPPLRRAVAVHAGIATRLPATPPPARATPRGTRAPPPVAAAAHATISATAITAVRPSWRHTNLPQWSMTPKSGSRAERWPCAGGGTLPGAVLRKRLGFTQSLSCGSCQAPSILRASARGEAP